MKTKCCYCGKTGRNSLKPAPGLPDGAVSHVICRVCVARADAEVDAMIARQKEGKICRTGKK